MGINLSSYGLNHGAAYAGMVADDQLANIISKVNGTSAVIPYGKIVFRDGIDAAKPGTSASTLADLLGVVVRELNRSYAPNEAFGAAVAKDMSVMTVGAIWVFTQEDVSPTDKVFVRVGATNVGDVAKSAGDAGTLSIEWPNAKFLTAAKAGELVKISIVVGG